jgi:hypothetical protein
VHFGTAAISGCPSSTVSQALEYGEEVLVASDAAAGDHFGYAVAVDGGAGRERALVGRQ